MLSVSVDSRGVMANMWRVELDGGAHVTAMHYPAAGTPVATCVLGHGAGAGRTSDFMTAFGVGLALRGIEMVTFNFPFTERGRKLPDPQPVLEHCFRAVLSHVSADPTLGGLPLVIGGKSLGGRTASHLAASRDADEGGSEAWWNHLHGLVFLGYPLHPPGKPQQVRVSHLPRITHPMLFVQGSKDAFGTPPELRAFTNVLPARCEIHVVENGGHSLEVPKRCGVAQADVFAAAQDRIVSWIRSLVDVLP